MGVRSVCLDLSQSLSIQFCHGIWARDRGNIARWWGIPRSVLGHLSFPSALIVFRELRCITSNARHESRRGRVEDPRGLRPFAGLGIVPHIAPVGEMGAGLHADSRIWS